MVILGIDTSESISSLSLLKDNNFLSSISINRKNKTASMLIPYIDFMLKEVEMNLKNIDLISICAGPGSYTSLRIGYSIVKSLSIVNNIKMIEVSRFYLMAHSFLECYHKISDYKKNITILLPTTYKKLLLQSFSFKKINIENNTKLKLIPITEPTIMDKTNFTEYYSKNNPFVIGKFKNHKKINDFKEIISLENYFEYYETGSSAQLIAEIGFQFFLDAKLSDPFKAEPLYIHSPF